MPAPASVTCPHCDSHLKLKDRSKLGQRITCPKCKKPFKAEAPPPDDEDEFGELAAQNRQFDEEDDLPPPRRPAPAQRSGVKKGKAKARSSGSKAPLIIGGVVTLVVFVGIGLGVMYFLGREKTPEVDPVVAAGAPAAPAEPAAVAQKKVDFSWLPPQSEAVVYVRPGDLVKSPFVQWIIDAAGGREKWNEGLEKVRTEIGLTIEDIESITVGVKGLDRLAPDAGDFGGGMLDPTALALQAPAKLEKLREAEISGVIRMTRPVDLTKIPNFQQEVETIAYNGATYYRDRPKTGTESTSFAYLPSPTLVVIAGREDVLKAAIDRQGKADPKTELEYIDPDQHLAIAFAVKPGLVAQSTGTGPAVTGPDGADPFAAFKKALSGCFSIKATDGLNLSIWQVGPDSKSAEEAQAAADSLVAQGKEQFTQAKAMLPENIGKLAETLLGSIKTTRRDRLVEVVATIPATSRDNLKALPVEIASMFMGGVMGDRAISGGGSFTSLAGFAGSDSDAVQGSPVVVESLSGLPDGVKLQGRAGWSGLQRFEPDGKTPLPRQLEIEIEYLGGEAARVVALGKVRVTQIDAKPAQRLKLAERPGSFGNESPFQGFVDVKHEEYSSEHPPDGARLRINFEPNAPISAIERVDGNVTLRVADETKEIIVPKLVEQAGKPTKDADLQAAGFAVSLESEGDDKRLVITFGKEAKVADLKFVDAGGNLLDNSPFLMRLDLFDVPRFTASYTGSAPAGMAAKVTLHTKIREVTVPFRFENLAVPPPPTSAANPVIPWRVSVARPALPDGLIAEGLLQWSKDVTFGENGKRQSTDVLGLQVDVTSPQVPQVVAVGFQKIEDAATNSGAAVSAKQMRGPFGTDATQEFVTLQRKLSLVRHPPDGVRVIFAFDPIAQPFTRISHVSGSLKLMTAKERKKIVFDKLSTRVGKTLSNADFRAAGLEVKLAKQGEQLTFQVSKGNPYALGEAAIIRDASTDHDIPHWSYTPSEKMGYVYLGEKKLGPKDSLEMTIYMGLAEVMVPFTFEDLIVPPVPPPEVEAP